MDSICRQLVGAACVIGLGMLGGAPGRAADPAVDATETARAQALFDARWERFMRTYPEWATFVGDHRHGDRLRDASPQAIAADFDAARQELAQARALRRDLLSPLDRTSLDVFIHDTEAQLRMEPHVGFRSMSMQALDGFQSGFAELLAASPVARREQVQQVLARMAAYPRRVDQELVQLRQGLSLRWVPPRPVLARVLEQIDAQLSASAEAGPFFEPFTRLGDGIPAADQEALRAQARRLIAEAVTPALRRLRSFVADEYLPAAPEQGGLSSYPGGADVYATRVREHTTTELTAAQIHDIGLRELGRLRGEMDAVISGLRFEGGFNAFVADLYSNPKFFHASPEALLAGYRDIAKRIDPELPKLFAELPRAPYGVKAMPAHMGSDRAEYYQSPALDSSQPGWFFANALAYRKRPTWAMETTTAHETVPGHHLHLARAAELGTLPRFRRGGGYTVCNEGWALYAETLGPQLGLYQDPYSRFGHLQWQAIRAARLVVDTGLHSLGWTRQQAIDFMVERTGEQHDFIASEVDRYLSDPGQALAYMIGQLEIVALRDRARAALGDRFDLRRFHMVLLDQGSVPLPVLAQAVDAWIARGP